MTNNPVSQEKRDSLTPAPTDNPDSKKKRNSLTPGLTDNPDSKKKRISLADTDISVDIAAVSTHAAHKHPASPGLHS